eukprot:TRINITY_DN90634_c0_g1_i1.p1 TRINITY_DN90634_c0_g1~~TRINITY_DN90634_c0_g1_i1.p1  ORF type:complete len:458 (+),score=75.14 TRINITY_DN90634_c0_g1_i1:36-1409(+)
MAPPCLHRLFVRGLSATASKFVHVASLDEFEAAVHCLKRRDGEPAPFLTLRKFLNDDHTNPSAFWSATFPTIVRWAARIEELCPDGVPYLTSEDPDDHDHDMLQVQNLADGWIKRVSFTREQAASLICLAFLCAVPGRDHHDESQGFAIFSFYRLFSEEYESFKAAKIKMMLPYFQSLEGKECVSSGPLIVSRRAVTTAPAWSENQTALTTLRFDWCAYMEDIGDSVQVGMSNRYPGGAPGGVLATGKFQEPAFFACRPEMLLANLVCAALESNEAAMVSGARQFGACSGFGVDLQSAADGPKPADVERAITQDALIVDGLDYRKAETPKEFSREAVDREILKLYAAFSLGATSDKPTFVTGNWCCDAFGGDKQLKAILQLIASSSAGVSDLVLCPNAFEGDHTEQHELLPLPSFNEKLTAGQLYAMVLDFLPSGGKLFVYLSQKPIGPNSQCCALH